MSIFSAKKLHPTHIRQQHLPNQKNFFFPSGFSKYINNKYFWDLMCRRLIGRINFGPAILMVLTRDEFPILVVAGLSRRRTQKMMALYRRCKFNFGGEIRRLTRIIGVRYLILREDGWIRQDLLFVKQQVGPDCEPRCRRVREWSCQLHQALEEILVWLEP